MSGPAGIFISKVLIQTIMWNDDKLEENRLRARSNYEFFVLANSLFVTVMIVPAFFLIKDHPPSPPSKVASKVRPHYSIWESTKLILQNKQYLLVFLHFQLVNTVAIFGAEITTFLKPYPQYDLARQNFASMLFCVSGIMGSLALGNLIDKYHCLRKLLIFQPLLVAILLLLTQTLLELNFPDLPVLLLISAAGAPLSSISVSSYQLAAQVTYPVNEVLSVGVMNTVNKIVTFLLIMASNHLPKV
jgi:predicted MFS family arabinose efflux permease